MKKYFVGSSLLALALGLATAGPVCAQNAQEPQAEQKVQANQPDAGQQQATKAFTGMIVKDGDRLVLQDAGSKMSYKIDDESKVKDYVGKQVKITGSLDASTNVIHVDSIEVVS